ncbi:hypothetical protein [Marilutibacter maris]|uniref:EamA domain-containing protein n=1 Tax=Marilutibacter maris TaxID=1605891 RepID=A0A2U9T633_9GAMM|nr:hypothetical protein [Lysobacter maris]AWV06414.1 hypothetical protein C9I47_0693 [Lysobacter maris]
MVALVAASVIMQLLSALVLKITPALDPGHALTVMLCLVLVLVLNVARFFVWGSIHRRFPISVAYPTSALFFPGILVMAWWFGEPIGPFQVAGAMVVMLGVALLVSEGERRS